GRARGRRDGDKGPRVGTTCSDNEAPAACSAVCTGRCALRMLLCRSRAKAQLHARSRACKDGALIQLKFSQSWPQQSVEYSASENVWLDRNHGGAAADDDDGEGGGDAVGGAGGVERQRPVKTRCRSARRGMLERPRSLRTQCCSALRRLLHRSRPVDMRGWTRNAVGWLLERASSVHMFPPTARQKGCSSDN
ncbi:unnamed protein product, partial [Prorocentrum cordatum]